MCPAVGQGALAVETRDDSGEAREICRRLEHPETRIAVTAERAVLAALGGGCQVPIGAHATLDGPTVQIRAIVVSPDGAQVIRKESSGPVADAATLGRASRRRAAGRRRRENPGSRLRRGSGSRSSAHEQSLPGRRRTGDPDLITWKGRKLLAAADAVLYDHLANEHLLDLARKDCERIYVGKKKSVHAFPQEEICAHDDRARAPGIDGGAAQGRRSVHLRARRRGAGSAGGRRRRVRSGSGSDLAAGHRGLQRRAAHASRSHQGWSRSSPATIVAAIDWSKVGQSETLVIFMGIGAIHEIAREIMAHGRSADQRPPSPCAGARVRIRRPSRARSRHRRSNRCSALEAARDRDHRRSGRRCTTS